MTHKLNLLQTVLKRIAIFITIIQITRVVWDLIVNGIALGTCSWAIARSRLHSLRCRGDVCLVHTRRLWRRAGRSFLCLPPLLVFAPYGKFATGSV